MCFLCCLRWYKSLQDEGALKNQQEVGSSTNKGELKKQLVERDKKIEKLSKTIQSMNNSLKAMNESLIEHRVLIDELSNRQDRNYLEEKSLKKKVKFLTTELKRYINTNQINEEEPLLKI